MLFVYKEVRLGDHGKLFFLSSIFEMKSLESYLLISWGFLVTGTLGQQLS